LAIWAEFGRFFGWFGEFFSGFFAGKPRRGMLRRAVFSDFQRKGLEKRFQQQVCTWGRLKKQKLCSRIRFHEAVEVKPNLYNNFFGPNLKKIKWVTTPAL
jgi:hypothetical protein